MPSAFKMFCVNELDIPAQSDFEILKNFFYYFFCDDEFQQLPVAEMERRMKADGKPITRQTIQKWIKYLDNKDIINVNGDFIYYVTFKIDDKFHTEEIPKERYNEAWKRYWAKRKEGCQWHECYNAMCRVNGGKVFKKRIVENNAFYGDLLDNLIDILIKEIK